MSGHVFVSHGSDDRVQANELAAFIEAKGARAWIAPRNVRPGQDYSEQLQEAIEPQIALSGRGRRCEIENRGLFELLRNPGAQSHPVEIDGDGRYSGGIERGSPLGRAHECRYVMYATQRNGQALAHVATANDQRMRTRHAHGVLATVRTPRIDSIFPCSLNFRHS